LRFAYIFVSLPIIYERVQPPFAAVDRWKASSTFAAASSTAASSYSAASFAPGLKMLPLY